MVYITHVCHQFSKRKICQYNEFVKLIVITVLITIYVNSN